MESYLFRAKRIDNGEFVIGNLLEGIGEKTYIVVTAETDCNDGENTDLYATEWYCVDPSTICQCTGLKDKKENWIWENDIVYMRMNGLSGYGKVVYKDGCYWVDDKKRGRWYPFSNHDMVFRVDGNVFDNQELLKVKE